MKLTFPDSFIYIPRIFGYLFDGEVKARLGEYGHILFNGERLYGGTVAAGHGLVVVRKRTGIDLEFECGVRDLPATQAAALPVFVLFYAKYYKEMHHRPTQKKVDKVSQMLGREPEWFYHVLPHYP